MVAAVRPSNNPLVRRKVGRARVLNETPVEWATPSAAGESYHPASHAFIAMTVCDVSLDLARSRLLRPGLTSLSWTTWRRSHGHSLRCACRVTAPLPVSL